MFAGWPEFINKHSELAELSDTHLKMIAQAIGNTLCAHNLPINAGTIEMAFQRIKGAGKLFEIEHELKRFPPRADEENFMRSASDDSVRKYILAKYGTHERHDNS